MNWYLNVLIPCVVLALFYIWFTDSIITGGGMGVIFLAYGTRQYRM